MAVGISSGGWLYIGGACGLTFVATLAYIMRFYIRFIRKGRNDPNDRPGLDDLFILLGLVFEILLMVEAIFWSHDGKIGFPAATLTESQMTHFLIWFWCNQLTYSLTSPAIKMGLLFFYKRLFQKGHNPRLARGISWLMFLAGCWGISVFLVSLFQCYPPNDFWNVSLENRNCKVNGTKFFLGNSISNLLLDILILCLPIKTVCKLQMDDKDKLGLLVVFLFGTFTCITALIRVNSLRQIRDDDIVLTVVTPAIWTTVEPGVAIICACLPSLRPIYGSVYRFFRPCFAIMCKFFGPMRPVCDLFLRLLGQLGIFLVKIGVTIFYMFSPRAYDRNVDQDQTQSVHGSPIHPLPPRSGDGHTNQDDIELAPLKKQTERITSISSTFAEDGRLYSTPNDFIRPKPILRARPTEDTRENAATHEPVSAPAVRPDGLQVDLM